MSALGAIQSSLIGIKGIEVTAPLTNSTGGTSVGDAGGGGGAGGVGSGAVEPLATIPTSEKVGAGFFTVAILGSIIGASVFMVVE